MSRTRSIFEMTRISPRFATLLNFIAALGGGIAMSQGFSFARWNEGADLGGKISEHAYLIGGCGLGVFFATVVISHLLQRIEELEKQVEARARNEATAWFKSLPSSSSAEQS